MYIEGEEIDYGNKFGGHLDFAQTGDHSSIQFLEMLSPNGKFIQVLYHDINEPLTKLAKYYEQSTGAPQKLISFWNTQHKTCYDPQSTTIKDILPFCHQHQIIVKHQPFQKVQECYKKKVKKPKKPYDNKTYKEEGNPLKIQIEDRSENKTYNINCYSRDPIGRIKYLIQKQQGIKASEQRLILAGNPLQDQEILQQRGITDNCKLYLAKIIKNLNQSNIQMDNFFKVKVKTINNLIYEIQAEKQELVDNFKENVATKLMMQPEKFKLLYAGKTLEDKKSLLDYNISRQSTVYLYLYQQQGKITNIDNALVTIKINQQQKLEIPFIEIKKLTVKELLFKWVQSAKQHYSLIWGKIVLQPHVRMESVEQIIQWASGGFTLLVLMTQKFTFAMNLVQKVTFPRTQFPLKANFEELRKETSKQIVERINVKIDERSYRKDQKEEYSNQEFYSPIQYYTSQQYFSVINKYLGQIKVTDMKLNTEKKQYKFMCSLINSLNKLPNYRGSVHRGLQNVRLSSHQKEGDLVCWKSITSTSINQQIATQNFSNKNGTLLHIQSMTGKNIETFSLYSYQRQVVFLPFTYFYIERIKKQNDKDVIWLTEVPSPKTFKKNIIVWVDDEHGKGNINEIKLLEQDPDIELITLSSTEIAEAWMRQFGWLLNWMDIKTRIITDMVRWERVKQNQDGQRKLNYTAGIDLLQLFYNKYGLTTNILIYCGDVNKAKENIKKVKIPNRRKYYVTNNTNKVLAYSSFKNDLDQLIVD